MTKLHCSAVLIPCDSEWKVVKKYWGQFLPEGCLGEADDFGWAPLIGGGTGRFTDVVVDGDKRVRVVVTADDDRNYDKPRKTARWVAEGVVEAIADLTARALRTPTGRVKALIGLPLVGTGAGGFETTRGVLIHALLPALRKAARDHDVDIALVLNDSRDHAAVQAVREPQYWDGFAGERPELAERLDIADELGLAAARGELSLFLGAGVSIPLGVPDWKTLLARVDDNKLEYFDTQEAPDVAQGIEERLGPTVFRHRIVDQVNVGGVAPTHLLLAALSVGQNVTTNYDIAYESALGATEVECRVLTRQLALQPHPWLLKYHGCVTRPDTIVITREDYYKLQNDLGALQSIVESLMLTSHLMFVGFSMADADFLDAAARVNVVRALADKQDPRYAATVLALHPQAVMEVAGFNVVAMLEDSSDESAARLLEIFLDRISWKATTSGAASSSYLLHPNYQDLFPKNTPTNKLRKRLGKLVVKLGTDDPICAAKGWDQVEQMLFRLGAPEPGQDSWSVPPQAPIAPLSGSSRPRTSPG